MKNNPVISLLFGLMITAVILMVLTMLYFFLTFDVAGGETLQEIESKRTALLFLTFLIAGLAFLMSRHFFKTGKKYTAVGISILPLIALIGVSIYYIDNYNYSTTFDQTTWKQEKRKPFNMTATLVKDDVLIGLTRLEVKEKLGEGYEEYDNIKTGRGSISYLVENDWTITVYFIEDKTVKANLRLPMMIT